MAGRHGGRGYAPQDENSLESTASSRSPAGHNSRPYHPTVANYRPRGYIPPTGKWPGSDEYDDDDEEEEEEEEEGYEFRAGASNDNPLYEVEESRISGPSASRQGQSSPNYNPLYGNDPFKPATSAAVCMTAFLKPKPGSSKGSPQSSGYSPGKGQPKSLQSASVRNSMDIDESTDEDDAPTSRRRPTPVHSPSRGRTHGKGLFQPPRGDQPIMRYPPARFSPLLPASRPDFSNQLVSSPTGNRPNQTQASPASSQSSIPLPQSSAPNIGDLIAAVRSDKNLLLGEVRKHANREPRVPGDHDRYFAPRKGDIIIHFTPSLDDNKLLEYYDERKSMLRLQPGDKLVRIKYDNYKLPDHLIITSKLYLYAPEWVYLGKALQTIKTV